MRIERQVVELGRTRSRHEPEVRAVGPLLVGHCTRTQMAAGPARRHHGGLDVVDEFVELPEGIGHGWPHVRFRRELDLLVLRFLVAGFRGTLAPFALASLRPMAIACLRLVTR